MKQRFLVRDEPTAGVFASVQSRRLLLALVPGELSLRDLATQAGLSFSLAHYHVSRLCDLGLVEVTRVVPRQGRGVKRYRACAHSFFLPAHLVSNKPGKQLAAELRGSLEQARRNAPDAGVLFFVDDQGVARMRRTQGVGSASMMLETWHRLALSKEDASTLVSELKALLARYEGRKGHRPKRFIAYCALAPALTVSKRR